MDEAADLARLWQLLAEAPDRGPWIRKWASLNVHGLTGDDVLADQRNIDLAVGAVNALPELLRIAIAAQRTAEKE